MWACCAAGAEAMLPEQGSLRPIRSALPSSRPGAWQLGNYEREPLDEFEEVRGVFYGGYGQVGQQFVVTNRRLLMAPIKLIKNLANDTSIEAAAFVAGQLQVPGAELVGKILQSYSPFDPQTIWLRHIADVRAGDNGGWLKAPQLVYTTDTEDIESIGVVHGMFSPNKDPRNRLDRDGMVNVLAQAVADAKLVPGP
jgi:hypothetical protein